jgi:dihydropyrimidinase
MAAPPAPVYSNADYSLIAGRKIKGWPILTMLRGRVLAQDGKVVEEPAKGKYIAGS